MTHLEPMEQEYKLTCKIVFATKSYEDEQSLGKLGVLTRPVVLLVPIENSQMYRFFNAWMGIPEKRVEVLLRFDHPFHQYARSCIMHPKSVDKESELEEHHLHLMAFGLSQMILAKPSLNGSEILISTCSASDDHPDGCPTDGVGEGDELFSGTRREVKTGLETPFGNAKIAPDDAPDKHGRVFPPLRLDNERNS